MFRRLTILAFLVAAPAFAASHVTPKPNARIGSAEKPYASSGAYRWLDDNKGDPSGTVIDHATVSARQRGVNLERESANITIVDSTFAGGTPEKNGIFPAGIYAEHGKNLLIERTTIRDWRTIADGGYRQGDCIDAEWGFVGLTLRNVTLANCTDGGYDGKAREVLLDRVTSSGNKKNFRIWYATVTATTIESINPTEAHIETNTRADRKYGMGAGGLTAQKVIFRSTGRQPLLSIDESGPVNIGECVIDVPAGTPFVRYHAKGRASNVRLNLGRGCAMDAKGFAINTPLGFDAGEVLKDVDGDGKVELQTASTIARINARAGTTLKRGDVLKSLGGTRYEVVTK